MAQPVLTFPPGRTSMLRRILNPNPGRAAGREPPAARRSAAGPGAVRRLGRGPGDPQAVGRAARRAVPAGGRRRVQRRQERLHQRPPGEQDPRGGGHPHHHARPRHQIWRRRGPHAGRVGARRHHRAGRAAPGHQHRRHPRHQRHPPRARGDHPRVRAALGHGALRHLGRPPVHRERARLPSGDPRLGEEDRHRDQQGRHPGDPRGRRPRARLRRRERPDPARLHAGDLPGGGPRSPCGPRRPATPPSSPAAASRRWSATSSTPSTRRSGCGSS